MKTRGLIAIIIGLHLCLTLSAQVRVVAHRGYWKTEGSAQNSVASLVKADSIGVFASEFDVWLTRDNRLVVNHDQIFQGVDIPASDFDNIRTLRLSNSEIIPSLSEYLSKASTLPNINLVLELKSLQNYERESIAVDSIVSLLRQYNLVKNTSLISFSLGACNLFRQKLPDSDIFYLNGDLPPKEIKSLGLSGIDYSDKIIMNHPEWVDEAHSLGLKVNIWTIDNPSEMKMADELGVDFLTTNEPIKAIQLYDNHHKH